MNTQRILELAGLPAQVGSLLNEATTQDMIKSGMYDQLVYTNGASATAGPKDEELNGADFDSKTGEMHVMNHTGLTATHKELVKRGWKRNGKKLPAKATPSVEAGTTAYEK